MKIKRSARKLLSVWLLLCFSICMCISVHAGEAEEKDAAVKSLGQEAEGAASVEITNDTGKDLAYFAVIPLDEWFASMENAWMEQSGEAVEPASEPAEEPDDAAEQTDDAAPEAGASDRDSRNLLAQDDVFTNGEVRMLYLAAAEEAEAPADEEKTEKASDPEQDLIAEVFRSFSQEPAYLVVFGEKGQEQFYALYMFPIDQMETLRLKMEGDVAYVEFTEKGSDEPVSTLEMEKSLAEALVSSPEDADEKDPADTAAAAEGSSDEPYIVEETPYELCSDPGHGTLHRVWSDGTVEDIPY